MRDDEVSGGRKHSLAYETLLTRVARRAPEDPWRLALRNAGRVFLLMAPLAAIKLLRHHEHVTAVPWLTLALVPVVVVAVCFAHAYLGAAIGRRRADLTFAVGLGAAIVGGVWFLTRSLELR